MDDDDDARKKTPDAREQALIAMLEEGMLPGIESTATLPIGTSPENALVFYRITRAAAEMGRRGGALAALDLMGRAGSMTGAVVLAFDGWAGDDRGLCEIPVVRDFCFGMVFGISVNPVVARAHAKRVLPLLIDEAEYAFDGGALAHPEYLQAAGALWLVGHAKPHVVFSRDPARGLMRDIGANIDLLQRLRDA